MTENHTGAGSDGGLKGYIVKNMLMGVILAVFVIILFKIVLGFFESTGQVATAEHGLQAMDPPALDFATSNELQPDPTALSPEQKHIANVSAAHGNESSVTTASRHEKSANRSHGTSAPSTMHASTTRNKPVEAVIPAEGKTPAHTGQAGKTHGVEETGGTHASATSSTPAQSKHKSTAGHDAAQQASPGSEPLHEAAEAHAPDAHGAMEADVPSFPVLGMAFVDAVIRPLDYELNHRFYGWRPNDILNFTDNINNFQLGVLEVTRRTAIILAERISRTGTTAAFDRNLENAMNWLMIKADRYWFPSAETKYKASLDEMRIYFHKLERGEAQFFTRTDNLIPLLRAYQDLLGSCDENLVKSHEDDGTVVSYFKADNYFFYAKGVASALATILTAIEKDFNVMVNRRGGEEVLHHAIESCHHAMAVDPWLILNSDLSSILANHRLNIAAPISHARFYLGVLIRTLST